MQLHNFLFGVSNDATCSDIKVTQLQFFNENFLTFLMTILKKSRDCVVVTTCPTYSASSNT